MAHLKSFITRYSKVGLYWFSSVDLDCFLLSSLGKSDSGGED
ncbi:Uncharacterised protein [Streptococcus pneumoniae]|nr:Uncharacterised protein [Streptococcus pneumoniae]